MRTFNSTILPGSVVPPTKRTTEIYYWFRLKRNDNSVNNAKMNNWKANKIELVTGSDEIKKREVCFVMTDNDGCNP